MKCDVDTFYMRFSFNTQNEIYAMYSLLRRSLNSQLAMPVSIYTFRIDCFFPITVCSVKNSWEITKCFVYENQQQFSSLFFPLLVSISFSLFSAWVCVFVYLLSSDWVCFGFCFYFTLLFSLFHSLLLSGRFSFFPLYVWTSLFFFLPFFTFESHACMHAYAC